MEFIVWTEDTRGSVASTDALLLAGQGISSRAHSLNAADGMDAPATAGKRLAAQISRALTPTDAGTTGKPDARHRHMDTVEDLVRTILLQALWVDRCQRSIPEERRRNPALGERE